ncbi:hypothetical protein ACIBJD_30245 [Kitasatospora sp. NPDC050467]
MRAGTIDFLVGAAFAVLIALAIATLVLGVTTAGKVAKPEYDAPARRTPN